MSNVALCTTMWDTIDGGTGAQREAQLRSDFWNEMIISGATTVRHDGTTPSAHAIIDRFLNLGTVDLQIQQELTQGWALIQTTAGVEVNAQLVQLQQQHAAEVARLQWEAAQAAQVANYQAQCAMQAEQQRSQAALFQAQQDQQRLAQDRTQQMQNLQWQTNVVQTQPVSSSGSKKGKVTKVGLGLVGAGIFLGL